jgi:NADH:ubiquinone oxidoreductase subunit E
MFRATRWDRNQILRLVLFSAAHSNEFNDILKQYKRKDVSIPKALWELNDQDLWLDNKVKRRNGEVHTGTGYDIQRTDRGGIIIKFD